MTVLGLISAFGGFQNIGQRTKRLGSTAKTDRVKSTINSGWNNEKENRYRTTFTFNTFV